MVDEIHERGMNEDFLLIILRDLLPHRPDLRLVLMSATINAELFSKYFGGAPMKHIPVSLQSVVDLVCCFLVLFVQQIVSNLFTSSVVCCVCLFC